MRKMKKIITLAMTLVMMMAMSMTAFATEEGAASQVAKTTIKVVNLQKPSTDADGAAIAGAEVKLYTVATFENNKIKVRSWADGKYVPGTSTNNDVQKTELTPSQITALKEALTSATANDLVETKNADANGEATFSVEAGVYYILATGSKATYEPMVAVTVMNDGNGNYVAKTETVVVKAKGTENDIKKTGDEFVAAGQVVDFTIEKTIPNHVSQFIVYDLTENLSSLKDVEATVKYGTKEETRTFEETDTENLFKMDLTDIVYKNGQFVDDFEGLKLTIEYQATVIGDQGYSNTPEYKVNDWEVVKGIPVIGHTAKIVLLKTDDKNKAITSDTAEFTVTKDNANDALYFVLKNGVYVLADKNTANATQTVATSTTDGKVTVSGLAEGTYHFTETKAPQSYSINSAGLDVTISGQEAADEGTKVVTLNKSIQDPSLISLPFTGGMGTTIFTILGVAIMAMAAALFFATKKSR